MSVEIAPGVELVSRREAGLRPPRSVTTFGASYGSTGHWEGPPMGDFPHASCASKVRGIQNFHMDARHWSDIAYSLVACPHGYVFMGRGPLVRTAANGTTHGNTVAGAVCYLGGVGDPFTAAGKRAMDAAFDYLDRHGHGPNRNGHRDWKNTQCPGDTIYAWIHAGQPVDPAPTPDPTPPVTPPAPMEDVMLELIQGDKTPEWYLSDMVNGRRHMKSVGQAARIIWNTVASGGKVASDKGKPIRYPEADIADLPIVGKAEPVETRTELTAKALAVELNRLTEEVRAWDAAVKAQGGQQ